MTTATIKIAKLLAQHVPADAREAESLRKIQALVENASAPFSRDHFMPGHLTASAMVFNSARTKTLLIFHGKLHMWLQPGGHFEPGEDDPAVASMREVREETLLEPRHPDGGSVLLDVDVHLIPARKNDPAHEHHDLRMLLIGDEGRQASGDGVKDAKWFTRDECAAMNLDPGLVRGLKKVLG